MATIFDEAIRIPFRIYEMGEKSILIPKELYMNFDTGIMYIKTESGNDIEAGKETINRVISYELDKLIGGANDGANTLKKLQDLLKPLVEWKKQMTVINDTPSIDTVAEILDKFNDMEETAPTILAQLKLKVLTEPGKGLSDEDFIDELYNKLLEVEKNANNYEHPENKVCNFEELVKSVNGETGDVIVTKEHLGLGDVEEAANHYIHPPQQQCNAISIDSCNGKTGVVTITKKDLELGNVQNLSLLQDDEIDSLIDESLTEVKYMTPKQLQDAIVKMKNNGQMVNPFIPIITNFTVNSTPSNAAVEIYYKSKWNQGKLLQVDVNSFCIVKANAEHYEGKEVMVQIPSENYIYNMILKKLVKVTFTINGKPYTEYENKDTSFVFSASSNKYWNGTDRWLFRNITNWEIDMYAEYDDYLFECTFSNSRESVINGSVVVNKFDLDPTLNEITIDFTIPQLLPQKYSITTAYSAKYKYSKDKINWEPLPETGALEIGTYWLSGTRNSMKPLEPRQFRIDYKPLNIIDGASGWVLESVYISFLIGGYGISDALNDTYTFYVERFGGWQRIPNGMSCAIADYNQTYRFKAVGASHGEKIVSQYISDEHSSATVNFPFTDIF